MKKKECWRLTMRGWLVIFTFATIVILAAFNSLFPFLAVNDPMKGELLVVEGWIPDYSLAEIKAEFEGGGYKLLVITGNPILKGEPLAEYKTYPELTRSIVLKKGWDSSKIVAVPSGEALRDRTYAAALALKDWIAKSGLEVRCFTIYSRGAHARRTRLMYEKAFPAGVRIGVIAGRDLRYDGKRWWKTSEGVRDIIDETIAYLYARLLFRPS